MSKGWWSGKFGTFGAIRGRNTWAHSYYHQRIYSNLDQWKFPEKWPWEIWIWRRQVYFNFWKILYGLVHFKISHQQKWSLSPQSQSLLLKELVHQLFFFLSHKIFTFNLKLSCWKFSAFSVFPCRYIHWFDGMAMMHRFHIRDGSVTYSSRFLRSDSYVQNLEKNRIVVSEFGTVASPDPCQSIFARFFSYFQTPRTCDLFTARCFLSLVRYE